MEKQSKKSTTSFKIVAIVALIWNLLGVFAYLGQVYMTDEMLAALPKNQQELFQNTPAWVTGAFAIAVFSGVLGSLFLLLRKKLAVALLSISLITVIAQMIYNLGMSNALEIYGNTGLVVPILTLIISVFLVWYSKKELA